MNEIEDYHSALLACITAAKVLQQHDLAKRLRDISTADTLGPMVDPTLWRDKHKAMYEDREVLEAALPLWKLGQRLGKEL